MPQQLEPDIGVPLLTFLADRVPPLGYRVYRLEPALAELPMSVTPVGTGEQTVEAAGWRVVLSPAAGGVTSLRERDGREWVDASKHRLGQAVRDRGNRDPWGAKVEQRALSTGREVLLSTGPVESRARMIVELPGLGQAGLRMSWSPYMPGLGVTLLADKPRCLDPETIFMAFPFKIPNARYRYELPLAVAEANADQLPNACRDWYAVQHFVDISNEERGVTVAFREAFLAEFGDIRTGQWLRELPPSNGALFANLMNNLWFTNYKLDQEGPVSFRFAILPHDGPYDRAKAIRFGFEQANPLLTAVVPAGQKGTLPPTGSFLTVTGPDTAILTVKQPEAGTGLIVRLYDVAGKAGERVLHLPLPVKRAARCSLVEVDEGELAVTGTEVRVPLEASGVATVRVEMP
ncbi:MAG: hypothetical protein HYU66_13130 [Armatimonadetes bacterium]|nr:hypothetical protein [Armatimonadota bacterium]